jgi:hypothetical protein
VPVKARDLLIVGDDVNNQTERWCMVVLEMVLLSSVSWGQKVRTGYERGVDFKVYKTYTWSVPEMPVTRPVLYAAIIGWVDMELKAKGLTKVEHTGDLILIPAGGMEFAVNVAAGTPILPTYGGQPPSIDATRWTGAAGAAYSAAGPYVPEGTFALTFVDRASNKIVWNGTVREKLEVENKKKSLDHVHKAVVKLVRKFPPGNK